MKKKNLIKKLKNTKSVVEFYKLKTEILSHLEEKTENKKSKEVKK